MRLIDLDTKTPSLEQMLSVLTNDEESELAIRKGVARAARLQHIKESDSKSSFTIPSKGTVLITGGVGELGQAVAKHLVSSHGVQHLVLTSRRGMDTPGAVELIDKLQSLGAESVRILSCNVSERSELADVITAIPKDNALNAVFHLAGIVDDGLVTALNPERLSKVLQPKVDGAIHLHELTLEHDLSAFVMFSSVSGVMGGAGQANYSAANVFLDTLASYRRKQGLPGISLAWGFWEQHKLGIGAHLSQADLSRIHRHGISVMSFETALALLDTSLHRSDALLVPVRFELARLQRQFINTDSMPSMMRGLVRMNLRKVGAKSIKATVLRQRLISLSENERLETLIELVQEEVAVVMGFTDKSAVPSDQPLKDLGLDSLMAVELRNQLARRAQTELPSTLTFDYPTPIAIAKLLLRQAFAELATEDRAALPAVASINEPIAIIAMSCRAPGGVVDPESYWKLLYEEVDAIGPFPERWNTEKLYDPDPEAAGKTYSRSGGFLKDVEYFDAGFFGITPREAIAMDPQQRLVLEVAWEALERAGIRPHSLNNSMAGVYLGSMGSDYGQGAVSLEELDGYQSTGHASSVLSGRLSYVLGLQGPAMTIDTACSSSLVALHVACAALRTGECDLALAGGVQVMNTPIAFVEFSRLRGIASDGRCKSFSNSADGSG